MDEPIYLPPSHYTYPAHEHWQDHERGDEMSEELDSESQARPWHHEYPRNSISLYNLYAMLSPGDPGDTDFAEADIEPESERISNPPHLPPLPHRRSDISSSIAQGASDPAADVRTELEGAVILDPDQQEQDFTSTDLISDLNRDLNEEERRVLAEFDEAVRRGIYNAAGADRSPAGFRYAFGE